MSKRIFLIVGLLVILVSGGIWIGRTLSKKPPQTGQMAHPKLHYQCPMHPGIVSDSPGNCPICQMPLHAVEDSSSSTLQPAQRPAQPKERKILFYRNAMRPDVTSPTPSKDEMGMDFVPVYEDEVADNSNEVQGHGTIDIPTERQQLIGVTTEKIERRNLKLEIRTVGRVAFDPELYNAMAEYREAVLAKERIKDSPWPTAQEGANALIDAARLKLRLMGLSDSQINQIGKNQTNSLNLLLPGKSVWVYGQVYEYEVDLLRAGQEVVVTTAAIPGQTFYGQIKAIDPVLNAATRSVRIRAEVRTPLAQLRPESFVNIKIQIPLGKVLAIPDSALLNAGETQIAFVKKGEGEFEPRQIATGREAQDYYEVISGLNEGEQVVTSANFLIDSESRFKAALNAFIKKGAPASSSPAHVGH